MDQSGSLRYSAGLLRSAAIDLCQPFAAIRSHSATAWSGPAAERLDSALRAWETICSGAAELLTRRAQSMVNEASQLEKAELAGGW